MAAGSSMAIGASLSSMQQASRQLTVISSNIANSDTRGYKAYELSNTNVVSSGGTVSSGVGAISRVTIDQDGQVIQTDVATDIMITGKGMIPVSQLDEGGNIVATFFTRDGSFRSDTNKRLVTPYGYALMAWPLDANGALPQTKSLPTSLQPVNVEQLIADASSTTEVILGAVLNSEQDATKGGVTTIDVSAASAARSLYNERVLSRDILHLNRANSLTQGEGIKITKNGNETKELIFDGFAVGSVLPNDGYDVKNCGGSELTITVNSINHQFTMRGNTNLEILTNLAADMNRLAGEQGLRARIINTGEESQLLFAPNNINHGMNFGGHLPLQNILGVTTAKQTQPFIEKPGAKQLGRFASIGDFAELLEKFGIHTTIKESPKLGAALTISSPDSVYFDNHQPLNGGSDFLREFILPQGYLRSKYDPYDHNYNMAGRSIEPVFTVDFSVYDSQGIEHSMIIGFLKTDANTWAAEMYTVDPHEVDISGRIDGLLAAGTVIFDGSGKLKQIKASTQKALTVSIADPELPLGATTGQTLVVQVNSTKYTYRYGESHIKSEFFLAENQDLVGNPGDLLRVKVGDDISGDTHIITRGKGTNNLEVLQHISRQINRTIGENSAVSDVLKSPSSDNYAIAIKNYDITKDLTIGAPPSNSEASTSFKYKGTELAGITGNMTLTINGNTTAPINLASMVGANDEETIDNIIVAINNLTGRPVLAYAIKDTESKEISFLIEPSAANILHEITVNISDTASANLLAVHHAGELGFELGVADIHSPDFDPEGTDLVGTPTDHVDFKIGANTFTVTRGNGTTNLEVLNNIRAQFAATPYFTSEVHTNGETNDVHLDFKQKQGYADKPFYITGGSPGFALDGLIRTEHKIDGNSFNSLYELAEVINKSTGSDAIRATVVPVQNTASFAMRVEPLIPGNYMSFDGSRSKISAPIGTGVKATLKDTLGLRNTSEVVQLDSLNEPIKITWAHHIGSNPNIINLNFGTIGKKDGLSQAAGSYKLDKISQNGISSGNLSNVEVDQYGYIVASFSNGQTRKVYKIPVADFANINGLRPSNANVFEISQNSGLLNLKEAGTQGAGIFQSGSLEGSNVDIAGELTRMIVAQQRYQASTKALATVTEMNKTLLQAI